MTTTAVAPRASLGLPAALLLAGQALYIVVTQLHAGGEANDHHHIFAEYAENGVWTAVHVGQFAGMALMLAGLFALCFVFEARSAAARWLSRFGAGTAVAALALYCALQAVDGVALKHAVMAWANAPEAEKAARFATAESIRWLEWGMRSYVDVALGITLALFAAAAVATGFVPRLLALFMALSGVAYLVQGWVAGTDGFTSTQSIAIVAAWALCLVWMTWLAIIAPRVSAASSASFGDEIDGYTAI